MVLHIHTLLSLTNLDDPHSVTQMAMINSTNFRLFQVRVPLSLILTPIKWKLCPTVRCRQDLKSEPNAAQNNAVMLYII